MKFTEGGTVDQNLGTGENEAEATLREIGNSQEMRLAGCEAGDGLLDKAVFKVEPMRPFRRVSQLDGDIVRSPAGEAVFGAEIGN